MSQYLHLLRENPGFTRLWLAQMVSLLGDWFNTIVLSTIVVQYNPGREGLAISGLLMARFLPSMIVSPVAGVLVDRFDRKRLLLWSNILRAGIACLFLLAVSRPEWTWMIYVLTVVQFTISAVFEPGQSALIPSLIKPQQLLLGNTLVNITWSTMLALGAAIGGIVASLFGATFALLIHALAFAVAALLISTIKVPRAAAAAERQKHDAGFVDGLRFLRRTPAAASLVLVKFGNSIGNIDTLMTIYATQLFVLGTGGELSLGIMYSVYGIGSILGPLLLNRVNDGSVRSMRRLIVLGFAACVFGWAVLGGASSLLLVCVALLLRAMGGSVNWTYSTVSIQKTVPDAFLGRVFSLDLAGCYLATTLSTLIHGSLVDSLGADRVPLIALGTGVVSMLPLLMWVSIVRWLERRAEIPLPAAGD